MASTFNCPLNKEIKSKSKRVEAFLDIIGKLYPTPECALIHKNPFELICATALSAQCTDKQVNKVTPALFAKYPDAKALAVADNTELEEIIHYTGFYKNKAKNLIAMAKSVVDKFDGEIPSTMDSLTKLAGVGRKTANVVLGNAFNIPSMVVDTHVIRISNRLGFVDSEDPEKIELTLQKLIPKSRWVDFSHQVIYLGREFCIARGPKCDVCPVIQKSNG